MSRRTRIITSTLFALSFFSLVLGIAWAATITVDGNPADWGATPPGVTDPDETGAGNADIPNDVDFHYGFMTADASNLYFRFDTYANTRWLPVLNQNDPYVWICIDVVGNSYAGASIPACNNGTSFDYRIVLGNENPSLLPKLQDCRNGTCANINNSGIQAASAFTVTEVSVPLNQMGLSSNCSGSQTFNVAFYFDNQDNPQDDTMPDSGTTLFTINCPTAVTLSSMTATAQPQSESAPVVPFALAGIFGFAGLGLVVVNRRRAH